MVCSCWLVESGCELGVCVDDDDDEGLCRNLYFFVCLGCVSCCVECVFDEFLRIVWVRFWCIVVGWNFGVGCWWDLGECCWWVEFGE